MGQTTEKAYESKDKQMMNQVTDKGGQKAVLSGNQIDIMKAAAGGESKIKRDGHVLRSK